MVYSRSASLGPEQLINCSSRQSRIPSRERRELASRCASRSHVVLPMALLLPWLAALLLSCGRTAAESGTDTGCGSLAAELEPTVRYHQVLSSASVAVAPHRGLQAAWCLPASVVGTVGTAPCWWKAPSGTPRVPSSRVRAASRRAYS
jgi:hypothetical protein